MIDSKLEMGIGWVFVVILGVIALSVVGHGNSAESKTGNSRISVEGVCPPFFLYDEAGNIIDPVNEMNSNKPYSPKQTCGRCHDYNKITEGFHFQQGRGEKPDSLTAERCLWVTTPGNYGGNW